MKNVMTEVEDMRHVVVEKDAYGADVSRVVCECGNHNRFVVMTVGSFFFMKCDYCGRRFRIGGVEK